MRARAVDQQIRVEDVGARGPFVDREPVARLGAVASGRRVDPRQSSLQRLLHVPPAHGPRQGPGRSPVPGGLLLLVRDRRQLGERGVRVGLSEQIASVRGDPPRLLVGPSGVGVPAIGAQRLTQLRVQPLPQPIRLAALRQLRGGLQRVAQARAGEVRTPPEEQAARDTAFHHHASQRRCRAEAFERGQQARRAHGHLPEGRRPRLQLRSRLRILAVPGLPLRDRGEMFVGPPDHGRHRIHALRDQQCVLGHLPRLGQARGFAAHDTGQAAEVIGQPQRIAAVPNGLDRGPIARFGLAGLAHALLVCRQRRERVGRRAVHAVAHAQARRVQVMPLGAFRVALGLRDRAELMMQGSLHRRIAELLHRGQGVETEPPRRVEPTARERERREVAEVDGLTMAIAGLARKGKRALLRCCRILESSARRQGLAQGGVQGAEQCDHALAGHQRLGDPDRAAGRGDRGTAAPIDVQTTSDAALYERLAIARGVAEGGEDGLERGQRLVHAACGQQLLGTLALRHVPRFATERGRAGRCGSRIVGVLAPRRRHWRFDRGAGGRVFQRSFACLLLATLPAHDLAAPRVYAPPGARGAARRRAGGGADCTRRTNEDPHGDHIQASIGVPGSVPQA